MNSEFGLKELYDLTLKATFPIEMDGRKFETGEVIARFDKIQLANFREVTSRVSANGGKSNPALIVWEDPKEWCSINSYHHKTNNGFNDLIQKVTYLKI